MLGRLGPNAVVNAGVHSQRRRAEMPPIVRAT